jgi:hypothetical protein
VSSRNAKYLTFFAAGVALAAVVMRILKKKERIEDQERPPIIVKGGSLIFQSGDPSTPGGPPPVPWMAVGQDWQPNQPDGVPVTHFIIALLAGGPPQRERTSEIFIDYEEEKGGPDTFTITMKPRPGSGTAAPTVVGPGLHPEHGNPRLLVHGQHGRGGIVSVRFVGENGPVTWERPRILKVWQER